MADDPESGVASDNDEIDKDGKLDEQECQNNNTRLIPKEEESRISISFFRQLFPAQKVDEVTPTKKKPLFKATLENFDPEENLARFTTVFFFISIFENYCKLILISFRSMSRTSMHCCRKITNAVARNNTAAIKATHTFWSQWNGQRNCCKRSQQQSQQQHQKIQLKHRNQLHLHHQIPSYPLLQNLWRFLFILI